MTISEKNLPPTGVLDSVYRKIHTDRPSFPEKIMRLVSSYLHPLADFVNLTDPAVLQTYLKKEFTPYVPHALAIARRVYETGVRSIADTNQGQAFPMDPEILAYAMRQAKGETVLEIGSASGENSILLAFSGAKRVYVNDITPGEILNFLLLQASLPSEVQKKLKAISGNCFDLVKEIPELKNKIGLILCRNVLHFFNKQQQADFFQLLKTMLKPGGRAILTINSIYAFGQTRELFEVDPNATCFVTTLCLVTDYQKGTMPCAILYQDISSHPEDSFVVTPHTRYLYERDLGNKWKVNNDQYNQLAPHLRKKIKKVIENFQEEMKKIKSGSVRILTNIRQIYSPQTLRHLLESHGLEVEFTFVTGRDGHLVHDDLFEKGQQMGAVVRVKN